MKVALDINGMENESGLGHHLRQMVTHMPGDAGIELLFYLHSLKGRPTGTAAPPGCRAPSEILFHRQPQLLGLLAPVIAGRVLERRLIRRGVRVFHGPSNIIPRLRNIPSVLTIHHYMSVDHELFPKGLGWKENLYFRGVDPAINSAEKIIAISEYTRRDLLRIFRLDPARVITIYPGGQDAAFRPDSVDTKAVRKKYAINGPYILCAGPLNERKNIPRLMIAFKEALKDMPGMTLLITGGGTPIYIEELLRLRDKLSITNSVTFTGPVARANLPAVYRAAEALIYPSLYEGFGYPPLEAMASGIPVAASNATCIPEIVGDAGLIFDPTDTGDMAEAIKSIVSDSELRQKLISAGAIRSKFFSWDKFAAETCKVYKAVAVS